MAHQINPSLCIACSVCAQNCILSIIRECGDYYVIDAEECVDCGTCAEVCPMGAVVKTE